MKCVKCEGNLVSTDVGGVVVDRCDDCSGIWFDTFELEQVLGQDDVRALKNVTANNKGHDAQRGRCPRCGGDGKLVRVVSPQRRDVHIDTCAVCGGQWLDGGELEMLRAGFWGRLAGLFRAR